MGACKRKNCHLAAGLFGELVEMALKDKEVKKLEELYKKNFKEVVHEGALNEDERRIALEVAMDGIESAKDYVASMKREQKNIAKLAK